MSIKFDSMFHGSLAKLQSLGAWMDKEKEEGRASAAWSLRYLLFLRKRSSAASCVAKIAVTRARDKPLSLDQATAQP